MNLPAGATPPADSPATVTQNLYQVALKNWGFSPKVVKAYQPFLTPGLYSRLWKQATKPTPPGDANEIDFDVITGGQDTPDKFEVGHASIDQTKAKVEVTVIYLPSEKQHYTVLLTQVDGAWKVDDIDYGLNGKLTSFLK